MRSLKAVLVLGGVACFSAAVYAALLGVGPVLGFPKTDFSGPSVGGTVYDATTRQLTVTALPVSTTFVPAGPARPVTDPKLLSFKLLVPDNAGTTTATVVGDDFLLTGQIDEDGDGSIDDAGVLLTGEILAFGWLNTPTPTDRMDFRFRVTGGSLAPKYNGKDIGVTLTMERSNFAGTFSSDFSAGSKGSSGPSLAPAASVTSSGTTRTATVCKTLANRGSMASPSRSPGPIRSATPSPGLPPQPPGQWDRKGTTSSRACAAAPIR